MVSYWSDELQAATYAAMLRQHVHLLFYVFICKVYTSNEKNYRKEEMHLKGIVNGSVWTRGGGGELRIRGWERGVARGTLM